MFDALKLRLRRNGGADVRRIGGRDLHLPDLHLHLPDLHLRDLNWEDVAAFAQGRRRDRDLRRGVILPTMLTLAGAGATLFWWRQWAQGRAESEAAEAPSPNLGDLPGSHAAPAASLLDAENQDTLAANLAVLGGDDPPAPDSERRRA